MALKGLIDTIESRDQSSAERDEGSEVKSGFSLLAVSAENWYLHGGSKSSYPYSFKLSMMPSKFQAKPFNPIREAMKSYIRNGSTIHVLTRSREVSEVSKECATFSEVNE